MEIHAAERYEGCDDLWTVTCVFNPSGYHSKIDNYLRFAQKFTDVGLPLVTVECAFRDAPWVLPQSPNVIRVRSQSILWQKERLLNIAISRLPAQAKKVAWVDGDLLFTNPNWAVQTSKLLDTVPFAQPFQHWCRLPEKAVFYNGDGESGDSFAYNRQIAPQGLWEARHGLAGFAWAARRELLDKHGLYDACIIGGGDHAMAHAITDSTDSICIQRILGTIPANQKKLIRRVIEGLSPNRPNPESFAAHYGRWARAISSDVQGELGWVPGHLLHLWHGSPDNRGYHRRHEQLRRLGYDPARDLCENSDGAWEWKGPRAKVMGEWAENYFRKRKEDG